MPFNTLNSRVLSMFLRYLNTQRVANGFEGKDERTCVKIMQDEY